MKKYVAEVKNMFDSTESIVEGYAKTPQDFHKIVLTEHIDWRKEEILSIQNIYGKKVFHHKKGFTGS